MRQHLAAGALQMPENRGLDVGSGTAFDAASDLAAGVLGGARELTQGLREFTLIAILMRRARER